MKNNFKTILILSAALSLNAKAGIECVGETSKEQKIVRVNIRTVGTMGYVESGSVEVLDKKLAALKSYELEKNEISQFFEGCLKDDCEKFGAIVGLHAYEDTNYDVSIRYLGKDYSFENKELIEIIRDPKRVKKAGNKMRVWIGDQSLPYEKAYFEFKDVVCSLDHDV